MRFVSDDPHLNIFRHYPHEPTHEDNVTRALFILMSRPPVAVDITRCFLLALREAHLADTAADNHRFKEVISRCLSDGAEFHFNMQEPSEVSTEEVASTEEAARLYVTAVALTPKDYLRQEDGDLRASRVDGVVTVSLDPPIEYPDGSIFDSVVILVETKLWDAAPSDQVRSHASHYKATGADAVAVLPWQQLYATIREKRTDYLDHEPIITDFESLINGFPSLTGWTGIKHGDMTLNRSTRTKLEQLCALVAKQRQDWLEVRSPHPGPPDITCFVNEPEGAFGNLGVACWEDAKLVLKLVAGARSRDEVDGWLRVDAALIASNLEQYTQAVSNTFPKATVLLDVAYRHMRAQQPRIRRADVWDISHDGATAVTAQVADALALLRDIHPVGVSSPMTAEAFVQARARVTDSESRRFEETFQEASVSNEEAVKWRQFGHLALLTEVPETSLEPLSPEDQVEAVGKLFDAQRRLLCALMPK